MEVGQSKMPNSEVAGQASVLIFPDLNTGNNTYKAVQEKRSIGYGPMLQGLNKPVNDLSRGCTVDDIINTLQQQQAQGL
jgi:phosphate acetyltransferase